MRNSASLTPHTMIAATILAESKVTCRPQCCSRLHNNAEPANRGPPNPD